jgi:hypothetical protein
MCLLAVSAELVLRLEAALTLGTSNFADDVVAPYVLLERTKGRVEVVLPRSVWIA